MLELFFGLFISISANGSSYSAYSVCDQIKSYNYGYSRSQCVRLVESADSFFENAVVLCETMAIKGHSQAALSCLKAIQDKTYGWRQLANCQFQADRGWSQSAVQCLEKIDR